MVVSVMELHPAGVGAPTRVTRAAPALPPSSGSEVDARRAASSAASEPRASSSAAAAHPAPAAVSRHAWFDLNGDGKLEDWSPLYGGDAYLAWTPPGGTGLDPGIRPEPRAVSDPESTHDRAPVAATDARVQHARIAYEAHRAPSDTHVAPAHVDHAHHERSKAATAA